MPSRGPEASARAWLAAAGLLLAGLLCALYAPVFANGFVWDDGAVVMGTRSLRPFTSDGLRWAWTSSVAGHYHPLTWLSFSAGERLLGDSPAASHAINLALHVLNAALFTLLGVQLLACARPEWTLRQRAAAALLAAALFALHPLRVESVARATERRDVLSASFVLAALAAYVARAGARRRARWYVASLALFALALLAKAQAVVPAVLLVLDFYPLRRVQGTTGRALALSLGRLVLEKLPFFALAGAASAAALGAQAVAGALLTLDDHDLAARAAQAAYGLVFYLRATFATSFSPLHERPLPLDWREARFVGSALACLLLVWVTLRTRRRWPALTAAAAAYTLFLLPVLGIFQSGVQLVAERYSYLACLGFALLAATGVVARWQATTRRGQRAALAAAVVTLLVGWSLQTRRQIRVWRNDETLWRHVLERGPSALASNNLGQLLAARGQYAQALTHLARALEVVPTYPRPWTALQQLLEAPSPVVPAATARALMPALATSARRQPGSARVWYTLGLARARADDPTGALRDFETALRLEPGHRGAAFGRALALERLQTDALPRFRLAVDAERRAD